MGVLCRSGETAYSPVLCHPFLSRSFFSRPTSSLFHLLSSPTIRPCFIHPTHPQCFCTPCVVASLHYTCVHTMLLKNTSPAKGARVWGGVVPWFFNLKRRRLMQCCAHQRIFFDFLPANFGSSLFTHKCTPLRQTDAASRWVKHATFAVHF